MSIKVARQRLKNLVADLEEHSYRYHVLDDPEIPDAQYLSLIHISEPTRPY